MDIRYWILDTGYLRLDPVYGEASCWILDTGTPTSQTRFLSF